MKKVLLPLLFTLSALLWAEIGSIDGVSLNTNFSSIVYSDTDSAGDTTSASRSRLFLQPSLIIQPRRRDRLHALPYLRHRLGKQPG